MIPVRYSSMSSLGSNLNPVSTRDVLVSATPSKNSCSSAIVFINIYAIIRRLRDYLIEDVP